MAEPAFPLLLRFIEKHSLASADRSVESAHWNQFRGPNRQGVAPGARIPLHFGPGSNVLWKIAVPPGHSSPVIWGDRLFPAAVDSGDPQALLTLAIDRRAGRILWQQQVRSDRPGAFHALNNAASATPVAVDQARADEPPPLAVLHEALFVVHAEPVPRIAGVGVRGVEQQVPKYLKLRSG